MPSLGNTPRPAYVYDTETDTWVPIGVGAHTHDYIPNTLVDAKGDILTATADNVPARLAKGADGTVLVSDSTTSTGLTWQPYVAPFVAGKNAIINGNFDFWQRGTSGTIGGTPTYMADRWHSVTYAGGTMNWSRISTSNTPIGSTYGIRIGRPSGSSTTQTMNLANSIETQDSLKFAGQIATISFWARKGADFSAASNLLYAGIYQGTGTDQSAYVTGYTNGGWTGAYSQVTLTNSWQKFSITGIIASAATEISAIFYYSPTGTASTSNDYYEISQVQIELGSVATPFSRSGGNIQGELAACQRYYFRVNAFATSSYAIFGAGAGNSTTQARTIVPFPVTMRVKPTSIDYPTVGSNFAIIGYDDTINVAPTAAALDTNQSDTQSGYILWTAASGVVASRPLVVRGQATTNAYLGFNAEL